MLARLKRDFSSSIKAFFLAARFKNKHTSISARTVLFKEHKIRRSFNSVVWRDYFQSIQTIGLGRRRSGCPHYFPRVLSASPSLSPLTHTAASIYPCSSSIRLNFFFFKLSHSRGDNFIYFLSSFGKV